MKGIPQVKLRKTSSNPLWKETILKNSRKPSWRKKKPHFLSFDDADQVRTVSQTGQGSDGEESNTSQNDATVRVRFALKINERLRKQPSELVDVNTVPLDELTSDNIDLISSIDSNKETRPRLSKISERNSEQEISLEESEQDARTEEVSESAKGMSREDDHVVKPLHEKGGKNSPEAVVGPMLRSSKLFEIMGSVRGTKAAQANDVDLQSLSRSDPGPNQSWPMDSHQDSHNPCASSSSKLPPVRSMKRQVAQNLTNYVERYRQDHVLHNKLFIPADDYETFAGAEDVGNNLMKITSCMNLVPEQPDSTSDPERNMSETELLDFMTKCIESRNGDSLDFMAGFFKDNTGEIFYCFSIFSSFL